MSGVGSLSENRVKLLVIEDDRDTRENFRDILELDDYAVEDVATAAEVLARTDWNDLTAVILDRQLPDGSAHSLLPELKKLAPEAAVIVVTGHSDLEGAIEALRLGASDYILKPVNADSLRLRIARVVEQKRLTRAKEQSESVFRNLVEVAEVMIMMLRPDGSILYFSPFAEEVTGYTIAEVLGKNYPELFVPQEERDAVSEIHRQALEGTRVRGIESRVLCNDGSFRWVLKSARCLHGYEGTDVLLTVQHDITELKHAQERALQAGRLAAIGHMVAGLAHESRNALQRSQACLEMLGLKVNDRPEASNLIERIQAAQDDLQRLFEDVRNYAAPIKLERRFVNLIDVWREAWSNASASALGKGRSVILVESVDESTLFCDIDPFRIGQVFYNVFDNALSARPDEVRVVVSITRAEFQGESAFRISIRDNGPGLSSEQRKKIFDSFYTTKTKGTGLGMAIVKRIIEAHGGGVEVIDSIAPGAEILLTLPRRISP